MDLVENTRYKLVWFEWNNVWFVWKVWKQIYL